MKQPADPEVEFLPARQSLPRVQTSFRLDCDPWAALPRAADDNEELADELLLIEMHLLKALKARKPGPVVVPQISNAAKERIIRSLKAARETEEVRPRRVGNG